MTGDEGEHRIVLRGKASADRFACAATARAFARRAGLSKRGGEELALAVSELASNVARHAVDGTLELRLFTTPRAMVEVVCRDRGPGIVDADVAREDGFSGGRYLSPDAPRGEGLGLGLGAVGRLVDELIIESSPGVGTTVVARKWIR
jgi:anti-sigma regulatory factor (Ser/Thr protein kinase)